MPKILIFLIGLNISFLSAQDFKLTGRVVDADTQEPLVGVSLFLQSHVLGGSYSGSSGEFTLLSPSEKEDTLFVSYMGYTDRKVAVKPGKGDKLWIELTAIQLALGAVVIKARRVIAEEFSVSTLKPLDIYTNPNAKADPLLAVQSMPASTTADETANVSLRGSPPGETGIYLNNVPIKDAVRLDQINGSGQFSIFNTGLIQSLHVFPSNPPLEFGAATSGAVVMNTSDNLPANTSSISVNLASVGVFGSRKIAKQTGITFYTNVSSEDGLRALNPHAFEKLKGFRSLDGGLNLIHHLNDQTRFKFFNYSLFEKYEYAFQHPSYEGVFLQNKKRNMSIANFIKEGDANLLEVNFLYDYSNSSYSVGNLDVGVKSHNYFASVNYHHFWDKLRVKGGLAFDQLAEDLRGVFPIYDYALAPDHPHFSYDTESQVKIPEGFGYAKYKLGDFSLGTGIRYNPGLGESPDWMSYQVNMLWNLNDKHRFILSGGKYHKLNDSNAAFGPSAKIASQQLALEYRYESEVWKWSSALYRKHTDYGEVENPVLGAEVFAAFSQGNFRSSISFAHIHSLLDDGNEVVSSSFDFDYFLRIIAKYKMDNGLELSLIYLNRQGQYFRSVLTAEYREVSETWEPFFVPFSQAKRLPDYKLLDMSLSKILPLGEGSLIVFMSANNVLNKRNIRSYSYNADYSDQRADLYNQRVIFLGGIWSF